MTFLSVQCPHCHSEQIVKRGKTRRGTQRYLCQSSVCATGSFLLVYHNRGCLPEVKQTVRDHRGMRECLTAGRSKRDQAAGPGTGL